MTPDQNVREIKARSRIEKLCNELGWAGVHRAHEMRIAPPGSTAPLSVAWSETHDHGHFRVCLPLMGDGPAFAKREVAQFLLRRNAELCTVWWGIDRWDGIAAFANLPPAATANDLKEAVERLRKEHAEAWEALKALD